MRALLDAMPEIAIVLLFAAAVGATLAILPLVARYALGIVISKETAEGMQKGQAAVTGLAALVAAFSLVQAQVNLTNVQKQVGTEASQMSQLDRLLARYGDPGVGQIRQTLKAYAGSVVREEWPELARGHESPITNDLFGSLSRSILAINPGQGRQGLVYADILKMTDELAESRSARVQAARTRLPTIFWEVILLLLFLVAAFALLGEARRGSAVALAGQGFGLALLIGLAFVVQFPFNGQTRVSPSPIGHALAAMQARVE
jgi:hypothetical protein